MLITVANPSSSRVSPIEGRSFVLTNPLTVHDSMVLGAKAGILHQSTLTATRTHRIHSKKLAFFGILLEFRENPPDRMGEIGGVHCDALRVESANVFHVALTLFEIP